MRTEFSGHKSFIQRSLSHCGTKQDLKTGFEIFQIIANQIIVHGDRVWNVSGLDGGPPEPSKAPNGKAATGCFLSELFLFGIQDPSSKVKILTDINGSNGYGNIIYATHQYSEAKDECLKG